MDHHSQHSRHGHHHSQDFSETHDYASNDYSRNTTAPLHGEKVRTTTSSSSEDPDFMHRTETNGIEPIRTISRIPGNPNYYEKNGVRTYGDGQDHEHEPKMTFVRFMALVAMAFLWCGSQIPIYLLGGILPAIYGDIGGSDIYIWAVIGNFAALAAVTPFVGAMSDLIGRRWVAFIGSVFIMVGMIAAAVANTMNIFILGETLAGVGSGICELTALAGTGEMAPTSKRGIYVGGMIITITPFIPSVLWAELIISAPNSSWRYVAMVCALWAFVGLLLVFFFYHPPPRPNANGLTRREIIARTDLIGGLLITGGVILFLAALIWGGYQYPWDVSHVQIPLFLGFFLMISFVFWEMWGTDYPMFPRRLGAEPRVLFLILLITFVSGANFFAVLIWWPVQSQSMYDQAPIQIGIRSLPIGLGIIFGAMIVSVLLGVMRGNIRSLLFGSSVVMTAGSGAMAIANLSNMNHVYPAITFAALGVGGVIIPNQIIVTIICPDDLIATATALALSIRFIGGAIGFAIYYNVFRSRYIYWSGALLTAPCQAGGIITIPDIEQIALDISANIFDRTAYRYPGINTQDKFNAIVIAGREVFSRSFPVVWYTAVGFGVVSIVATIFLGNIQKYMDNHIAVQLH